MSDAGTRAFRRARLKKEQKKAADGLLVAALDAYNARRYTEASFICGEILTFLPDNFDALNLLGVSQMDSGQKEEAEATLRRAVAIEPRSAEAHCNHGVALFELKRYEEARAAYERALALKPKYPTALNNLGNAWKHLGFGGTAIQYYEKAVALKPDYADAWCNCGAMRLLAGDFKEADRCFSEALRLRPRYAEALCGMGQVDILLRRYSTALQRLNATLALRPDMAEAFVHRGRVFAAMGDSVSARRDYEAAVALAPTMVVALVASAEAAAGANDSARAAALARQVLEVDPAEPRALTLLGGCLALWGDIPESIRRFDEALAVVPHMEGAVTAKIFAFDFHPTADFAAHQAARRWWWDHIGAGVARRELGDVDLDPARRLRIGYVSSDFRRHSAGLAILPVFKAHDHAQFEIIAYHCSVIFDPVTEEFRSHANGWVDAAQMSDDELSHRILADRIDILVDLSGHTAGNRLRVFASKPAPIQVSAWGHSTGTGIPLIDYMFNDKVGIPDEVRPLFAEKVVDLPCLITMTPPGLPVSSLPMQHKGHVTFGVFNRIDKISDEAIALWSRVLAAVPDARLTVKHGKLNDAEAREALLRRLVAKGIAAERVTFLGGSMREEHLRAFDDVDISLDPFPMNGGVSTWESLFMGVPVVTKLGSTAPARISASILTAIGLEDFVAADDDAYVEIARRFASSPELLAELRAGLPDRIAASEAGDPVRYTRAVEAWYRRFWQDYCAAQSSSTP